ncbi:Blp family class II bacteriocin [Streptococcus saliviloxodontae]|uniref:ComC/BlpC family peptide pheromone/bacteriocin n=1 Tax=Streptococcus saliviloxodontae TaxID=1349416 RepID=A0ABS2PJE0_9STRE|nr:Blp family class II bacteriocin [Streptococcus saliviloxodontae]MBM7635550.1 hypothetical protein [Streptococcus saliviloxodontae]
MNTKTFEKFELLDYVQLSAVEGGGWFSCGGSIALGAAEGYMATAGGTIFLGPYALGTGAVGAVIGGIGGAFTC